MKSLLVTLFCCIVHPFFGQTLTDLFPKYMELNEQGNYAAAAPLLEQIVKVTEQEYGRNMMYFNVLIYTKDNYLKLFNYAKAAEYGERLDSIYADTQPYSDDGLINLNETFSNYTYAGVYGKAQIYAEKSLKEYEKRYGKKTTDYATALSQVGVSYQAMSLHEKSLEYFNQALATVQKIEPNSREHFTILNNVMTGEFLSGRKKEASAHALEVLNMAKALFKDVPLVVAHFHGNYGIHLQSIGELATADVHFTMAQQLFEKNQLTTSETYGDFLSNYSVFLFETDDLEAAHKASEQSLSIFKSKFGPNSHRTFYPKINLGIFSALNGAGYPGIRKSTEALEQYLGRFKSNQFVLTEKDRIESRKFFDQVYGMLIGELLTNDFPKASEDKSRFYGDLFNLHINSKGMVLSAINKTKNQILSSGNPALITGYNDWIQLKNQISFYNGLTLESLNQAGINLEEIKKEAATMEKNLFTLAGLEGQLEDEWITWQQIRDKLNPDEVAVEIVRTHYQESTHYMALILSNETKEGPLMIPLADAETLEESGYKYYKNCIEYEVTDLKSYALYWKPIEAVIDQVQPNNKRVTLSTEGIYNLISLNSMKVPESGRFLVEDSEIKLMTNSINLVMKVPQPSGADSWLIGDPDFTAPPSSNNQRGSNDRLVSNLSFELSKLPGTFDEVTSIGQLLPSDQPIHILTAKNANETAVKKIQSPKMLHFATHGYFAQNDQAMLNTGIALSGLNTFYNNPAAYSGDDGLLTSYEIQGMNLTGTDLVVLSACETGLGNAVTGEGVFGLQRAFRIAGAETLIMSLWKVDDRATQLLMSQFYKNQQLTSNLNEAFRQAQNQLMEEYPNPKYWGAFLLVE
ncbi:MAG: CHAT domain-containing tetratricopeptide repeat protein [Marinoscillum sp.]